jgi:hypothetical protein
MKQSDIYRETCTVIAVAALLFYFLLFNYTFLLFISVLVGASGLFIPFLRKWIHMAWMQLAHIMGWVMSKVILGLVFYLFLTPIALLKKVFSRKGSKSDLIKSNWHHRKQWFTLQELKKIW